MNDTIRLAALSAVASACDHFPIGGDNAVASPLYLAHRILANNTPDGLPANPGTPPAESYAFEDVETRRSRIVAEFAAQITGALRSALKQAKNGAERAELTMLLPGVAVGAISDRLPLCSSSTPQAHLDRADVFEAIGQAMLKVEQGGASPELTDAVTILSDLRSAIGNQWNHPQPSAAKRVLEANEAGPNTSYKQTECRTLTAWDRRD